MVPMQIRNSRLNRAEPGAASWLGEISNRQGARLNTRVEWIVVEGTLRLSWK